MHIFLRLAPLGLYESPRLVYYHFMPPKPLIASDRGQKTAVAVVTIVLFASSIALAYVLTQTQSSLTNQGTPVIYKQVNVGGLPLRISNAWSSDSEVELQARESSRLSQLQVYVDTTSNNRQLWMTHVKVAARPVDVLEQAVKVLITRSLGANEVLVRQSHTEFRLPAFYGISLVALSGQRGGSESCQHVLSVFTLNNKDYWIIYLFEDRSTPDENNQVLKHNMAGMEHILQSVPIPMEKPRQRR